jgi:polar amino acid transport system substrate-binding protein
MPVPKHVSGLLMLFLAGVTAPSHAADFSATAALRVTYLGTNPSQARQDPKTGTVSGPAAELARELAKRLGVSVTISPVPTPQAVIDSVKSGAADLGFVAYDATRARDVEFSQTYLFAWNSYLVPRDSPLLKVEEVDLPGVRIGVGEGDSGHLYLQRALRHAELKPNPPGSMELALKRLADGEIDVYAASRPRLLDAAAKNPGVRVLPDNFYGVEQAIIVNKGEASRLAAVNRLINEARTTGLIQQAIDHAELKGVDVAPAGSSKR